MKARGAILLQGVGQNYMACRTNLTTTTESQKILQYVNHWFMSYTWKCCMCMQWLHYTFISVCVLVNVALDAERGIFLRNY